LKGAASVDYPVVARIDPLINDKISANPSRPFYPRSVFRQPTAAVTGLTGGTLAHVPDFLSPRFLANPSPDN
jgi:hypothetical protein